MHTLAPAQVQSQRRSVSNVKKVRAAAPTARRGTKPLDYLQGTVGNHGVLRSLHDTRDDLTPRSGGTATSNTSAVRTAASARFADVLSTNGEVPEGPYLDQAAPAGPGPAAGPAPAPAPAGPAAAVAPARPTDLIQILTGWAPGANRYGFQLKFRCRSTSGDVRDLQNQAPNLIWREHVTYTRNDFAHRINPPSPTILPAGGVPFAAANTRRVGPNLLEFNDVTDTHWMPTNAVRANDFRATAPPPGFIGPVRPLLPAVMESRQVYQYSPDGGATWRYFAGAFIIRRTLLRIAGALRFRTQKTGVHTVTEPYKP